MLTIRFRTDGGYLSLHMDGHATGSPAVCAAASALACTLAGWLDRHGAEADSRLEAGTGAVRCRDTAEARTAFEVVAVGLAMLAEAHTQTRCRSWGKPQAFSPRGCGSIAP